MAEILNDELRIFATLNGVRKSNYYPLGARIFTIFNKFDNRNVVVVDQLHQVGESLDGWRVVEREPITVLPEMPQQAAIAVWAPMTTLWATWI